MACSLFLMALLFLALTLPPGGHSIDLDPEDVGVTCYQCAGYIGKFCSPYHMKAEPCSNKGPKACQIIVTKTNKIMRRTCVFPWEWECVCGLYEGEEAEICTCAEDSCNKNMTTAKASIKANKGTHECTTKSLGIKVTPSGIFFIVVAAVLYLLS